MGALQGSGGPFPCVGVPMTTSSEPVPCTGPPSCRVRSSVYSAVLKGEVRRRFDVSRGNRSLFIARITLECLASLSISCGARHVVWVGTWAAGRRLPIPLPRFIGGYPCPFLCGSSCEAAAPPAAAPRGTTASSSPGPIGMRSLPHVDFVRVSWPRFCIADVAIMLPTRPACAAGRSMRTFLSRMTARSHPPTPPTPEPFGPFGWCFLWLESGSILPALPPSAQDFHCIARDQPLPPSEHTFGYREGSYPEKYDLFVVCDGHNGTEAGEAAQG